VTILNHLLKIINERIQERSHDLFSSINLKNGLLDFVHKNILREDATSLQFTTPVAVNYRFDKHRAISEFSKLLLPEIHITKHESAQQKEESIIKSFTSFIFNAQPAFKRLFERNYQVKTDNVSFKFDLAWQNGSLNLITAISLTYQTRVLFSLRQ